MRGSTWIIIVASLFGCTGLIFGAYGAHGLNNPEAWQSAVRIQTTHALLLIGIAALIDRLHTRLAHLAALLIVLGVMLFSGSIYLNTLGIAQGSLAPFGGGALMLAWISVGLAAVLRKRS